MRIKRFFAYILILAILLSLISGCGKNSETKETDTGSESAAVMTDASLTSSEEESAETEAPSASIEESKEEEENVSVAEETSVPPETSYEETLPSVSDFSGKFVVTGAESLNVRAACSTESEIIDGLMKNARGEVTGISDDGAWYRITLSSGAVGYIAAAYVTVGDEAVSIIASLEESAAAAESESAALTTAASENAGNTTAKNTGGGLTVCIDAGHQQHGISETEPNGPGSSVMKAKLTTGTAGCVTGKAEYQVNLEVSLKLQQELINRGYNVVMVRTTNDCPMSNAERAVFANESGADCFVRIHCNSLTDSSVTGVINYAPSAANPYMGADLIAKSNSLAACLAEGMCASTGAINRGVLQDDTMTGINWCKVPVSIVEMGFMSNPTEDQLLSDESYQWKLAKGMADGLDLYFGR